MSLKYAVLGVLDARSMTGYELSQFLDGSTGWLWAANHSQIYPLLGRLVEQGLVVGVDDARGEQRRTTYTLTDAGREDLLGWVSGIHPPGRDNDAFALQAVFLDMVPGTSAAQVLREYADRQRAAADQARQHSDQLAAGETPLIRERLQVRPTTEHEAITRLKATVFAGQAAVATARAEWAEAMLVALAEVGRLHMDA